MEEIIIGGQSFPKKCPEDCPEKNNEHYQGCPCHRCPIFNCADDDQDMRLLEPQHYRKDWAKAWKKWFDNGMLGLPDLRF